jgi:uncharacterized protein YjbI with pentapeptide repeats
LYFSKKAIREFKNAVGTNFKGAVLKGMDFSGATLNNCGFDNADTSHVNWSHVQGARSSIDFTDVRMQLLISRKGNSSIYTNLDLSERNLNGVELVKANLSGADLTRSNLRKADLTLANLANTKAGNADFSHATLTGACIQNWTINSETQFDGLVCEHIFLTPDRDPQNRRPLFGSFEPGDFAKLVDKFADSLDFILRRGTDPALFRQSLNQFQQDNPEAKIKMMVDLDADRVLVQATLPEGMDKVKPYEAFLENQAQLLQAAQQYIRYLEGRLEETAKSQTMMERLFYSSQRPIQVLQANNPTGPLMPDNRNQSQAGGDIISVGDGNQGVVGKDLQGVAGRDISGTLNLSLAALSETADPKAKELGALITQLKTAIEAPDSELEARHKTRALEYLDNLTKLAQNPTENHLKTAKENLDDLADIAEKGSKIATFAEKYLPTFSAGVAGLRLWFGI